MMPIDPDNPVVRLCAEGMQLEQARRLEEARLLFDQAWETARDDYEACIAAHFVARHKKDAASSLAWNQESLRRAEAVADRRRIAAFMPSLLLNVGFAHEGLGHAAVARALYERAARSLSELEPGPYRDVVQSGVARALERLGPEANIVRSRT